MIHSAAAIQIPQIIISDDRDNIDFVIRRAPVQIEISDDDDESAVAYFDDEIDEPTPRRRNLRADNVR